MGVLFFLEEFMGVLFFLLFFLLFFSFFLLLTTPFGFSPLMALSVLSLRNGDYESIMTLYIR